MLSKQVLAQRYAAEAALPLPIAETSLLQDAVQAGKAESLVRALKEVKLADLRAEVAEAALTNELRSGERGKTAQNRLLSLEARYALHCSLSAPPHLVFR